MCAELVGWAGKQNSQIMDLLLGLMIRWKKAEGYNAARIVRHRNSASQCFFWMRLAEEQGSEWLGKAFWHQHGAACK